MTSRHSRFFGRFSMTRAVGIAAIATVPIVGIAAWAQTAFPDTEGYWAQPFIEALAERDIVTGYPDGTFRPEESIDRDEYAAMLRQAFNPEPERQIPEASVFSDVPEQYWAAPAIEEAYEAGFMGTLEENRFYPQMPLTRVEGIVATVNGLDLLNETPVAAAEPTTIQSATTAQPETAQPSPAQAKENVLQQDVTKSVPQQYFLFPLASTTLMQFFAPPAPTAAPDEVVIEPANLARAVPQTTPTSAAPATPPQISANTLNRYYGDADQIPEYARDAVAAATEAGIIVNYPEPNLLNPNEPLDRGAAAALVHQTLVQLGRLEPLPDGATAKDYVIQPVDIIPAE